MARYSFRFSCGHEHEIVLYGPMWKREKRINHLKKEGLCNDCFKEKNPTRIYRTEQVDDLPELKGSEKQIAWAISIRNDMIQSLQSDFEKYREALEYIMTKETNSIFFIKWRGADNMVLQDVIIQEGLKNEKKINY